MRSVLAPACGLLVLSGITSVQTAAQSEPISLAPFRSVELRNGAHAILRYGQTQRVTFLKGSPDRSMSVGSVTASVLSGGRILAKPLAAMTASVADGGNVTYWGDARVTQSIQHGGVVERGTPSDADRPISEIGDPFAPVPPIPPVRPIKGPRR
jgi:hypothetical protein